MFEVENIQFEIAYCRRWSWTRDATSSVRHLARFASECSQAAPSAPGLHRVLPGCTECSRAARRPAWHRLSLLDFTENWHPTTSVESRTSRGSPVFASADTGWAVRCLYVQLEPGVHRRHEDAASLVSSEENRTPVASRRCSLHGRPQR